jgi:putative endonuclease
MPSKQPAVYMLASRSRTLYVGVTSDLLRRAWQHRERLADGFAARFNIHRLVWYEVTANIAAALAREKEIKGWRRSKKVALIEVANPTWEDLAAPWFGTADPSPSPGSGSG